MSRILKVLQGKNNASRKIRLEQQEKLDDLKKQIMYSSKLKKEMKIKVDELLETPGVTSVVIDIPQKMLSLFMASIYKEEFSIYSIKQVPGRETAFDIRKREVLM